MSLGTVGLVSVVNAGDIVEGTTVGFIDGSIVGKNDGTAVGVHDGE